MNWAVLSTVMVAVHLVTEYAHYIIEFCWGKKDKDILKDILQHRKSSRKSEMLVEIVQDLRLIKTHLGITSGCMDKIINSVYCSYNLGQTQ